MKMVDKLFLYVIGVSGAVIVIAVVLFAHSRDEGIRNQRKVVVLLTGARAEVFATDLRIRCIVLPGGARLAPGIVQVIDGYKIVPHVQGVTFTIEAEPVVAGKTGLFSYFRDLNGAVRFEIGVIQAGPDSRLIGFAANRSGVQKEREPTLYCVVRPRL